ncbi:hypothetical protein BDA99DRAFT_569086 [Phascolomyces articulosus]|uniref:Uncharacterized protein n=1 Tax=Phascolomyces articulosus TaxID=60185 RepID=A0AAD5KI96_9FUNG|nr:hypothetical protein BDA99DRAFT_569086 [Phascolomyces articulosus]
MMTTIQLPLHYYTYLTYGQIEPSDLQKRCSPSYKNNCLVFIFDDPQISFDEGWALLRSHFSSERGDLLMIDAMRKKPSTHSASLIIEAHFTERESGYKAPKASMFPKVPPASSVILKRYSTRNGNIELYDHQIRRTSNNKVTVRSTIPETPIFRVYRLHSIPLVGNPRSICDDISEGIRDALRTDYKFLGDIPTEIVVDVVEGFTGPTNPNTWYNGRKPLSNGTFHVIIDTTFLPPHASPLIKFKLYDHSHVYILDNPTSHYLYCTQFGKRMIIELTIIPLE